MSQFPLMDNRGYKDDDAKNRMDLLPFDALAEVALTMTWGGIRYAPNNWTLGMPYSRLEAAMLRHFSAYKGGEDRDPETGILHLAHAAFCLLALTSYQLRDKDVFDDRIRHESKGESPSVEDLQERVRQLRHDIPRERPADD